MSEAMFFVILNAITLRGISADTAINIAWDSDLMVCNRVQNPKGVFDGNRFKIAHILRQNCDDDFEVHYGNKEYDINYVVLYGGQTEVHGVARFDVEFRVYAKYNEEQVWCGRFMRRRTNDFRGMRVNCLETGITNSMSFHLDVMPFYLNEIELYSFATDGKMSIYRGCFKEFEHKKYFTDLNRNTCKLYCIQSFNTFVAFRERDCYCANSIDFTKETTEDQCDITCYDVRLKICGGKDAFSVFIVNVRLPTYKSCIKNLNLNITTEADDMTIAKCLQICDNHLFAALKAGSICECFNESKLVVEQDGNCSFPCKGDPSFYCGGPNVWSVYGTCMDEDFRSQPCSKLLNCKNGYDVYGVCHGGCQKGFIGEHCIEKEAEQLSYLHKCSKDTCANKANSYCYYNRKAKKAFCYCHDGFWSSADEKTCEDIDECIYNACNEKISYCQNTVGSYKCVCRMGYTQESDTICSGKYISRLGFRTILLVLLLSGVSWAILYSLAQKMHQQ